MFRKTSITTLLSIAILFSLPVFAIAEDRLPLRVYNPKMVTSDLDATYIRGEVSEAIGQKIVVNNTDGVVAEKVLPNTGDACEFRIKLPKSSINTDNTTMYAVTAQDSLGERIRTTYVRVSYKAKKAQQINLNNDEYNLNLPGEGATLNATSSAGLNLIYSSDNEGVVKVDDKGNIEPMGGGSTEITISQINDSEYESVSKKIKVSVKEVPYYTIRYHLGVFSESDFEKADDNEITVIAGAYSESDEGSGEIIAEQKIAIDQPTKLLEAAEKKGDYEFLGWTTSSTGYTEYENSEEVTNLAEEGQTVDLYAIWHGERAQKAIDWAIDLADNNAFTYGQGTFRCYFCGTAPKKMYTCMPYLAAAYAHGAEDPIMLSGGKHVINLHDGNFKGELGTIWEKIGLCSDVAFEDLRPGDVIIKYSSDNGHGHSWMYIGGDNYIDATPKSNSNDDIAVRGGAASYFRSYKSGRNFVMRYRF